MRPTAEGTLGRHVLDFVDYRLGRHCPRRAHGPLTSVAPFMLAFLSVIPGAVAYSIGVTDGLAKIRSDRPPPANLPSTAMIKAAKNEFESFQIVLTGPATGVNASVTDLALAGGGFTILASNMTVYREEYIQVTTPSSGNPESVVGWWPDPLIPAVDEVYNEPRRAFPFDVPTSIQDPTHQTRAIWVDVFVPKDALPGDYTGEVSLTFAETATPVKVPVQLHVWNFQLDPTPHLKSYFRLNFPNLCNGHGVAPGSTAWAQLQAAYIQLALDHRITIPNADYGGAGTAADTWSNFQDLIAGSSQPLPRRSLRLGNAQMTWIEVLNAGTQAGITEWWNNPQLQPFRSAFNVYLCDEPDNPGTSTPWSSCVNASMRARSVSTTLHTSLTADWTQATTSAGAINAGFNPSMADVFIPLVDHLWAPSGTYQGNPSPPPYGRMGDYAGWLSQNTPMRQVMDYQSCDSIGCGGRASGWPNYSIDANPVQNRASPWLSFIFGTSGEFYYDVADTYTPNSSTGSAGEPWRAPFTHGGFGEGTLFYPGVSNSAGRSRVPCGISSGLPASTPSIGGDPSTPHDIAVPSMRLKLIRDGIEDYEYLSACKAAGADAVAKALSVFPNAYSTDTPPATLAQVRQDLAACIEPKPAVFSASLTPSAVSWGAGRLDVFTRGSNDGLFHEWWQDPGPWSAWEPHGGGLTSKPVAVSWGPGRIDVFIRGTDNALYHKWWQDPGPWSGWEPQGGGLTSDPAVVSWGSGRLDVFVRGLDNGLYHKWWQSPGPWSDWEPLGGALTSNPAAVSWGSGRIDVFVRGNDNAMYHKWWQNGWSDWEPQGGILTSDPAAVSWGPGRLDVFARGADNALYHKWWENGWSDWEPQGGGLTSDPVAVSWAPGRLDVFVRGLDNALYHKWWQNGWSDWEPQGGGLASDPAAVSWGPGRIDVFVRGIDNGIYHKWWQDPGPWSGWEPRP